MAEPSGAPHRRAPPLQSGTAPPQSLAPIQEESQFNRTKKHILSKHWPASAANSLVRNIGITGAGWREHLCKAHAGAGRGERSRLTHQPPPLRMLWWDAGGGGLRPNTDPPTHLPVQGDHSDLPKTPQGGGCDSGDSPRHLTRCKFPLGEHWSNGAPQRRMGAEGLLTPAGLQPHISCPPCRRIP